jgi:serine/threonine-protein kinase
MTVTPQTLLDERYLLLRRLAFGGMGEVWEGTDVVLDRAVAVKILRAELADDDAFRRRFRAEARTAGRVPHPGIAAVFDYGETTVDGRGLAYLVMELVPGEALSAVLAREGALGTDRTLDVVAQTARALQAAHERGVIHRDVKPANLLVTPDGRIKVTDFGIARPDDHEPLTATGQVMGTAHYLAPELARGRAATPASDIYALGVVMYECLAGRRPFEGDDQIGVATAHLAEEPPPLPATIAPEVRALVAAAMEKDPQHRIAAADAFAAAAEALRLRPHTAGGYAAEGTPGQGYPGSGGWAGGTGPTLLGGAAAGAAAAGAAARSGATPWVPGSYPGTPVASSGLPQPGTATPSGALLFGGTPPAGPDLFHPATAAMPQAGLPRTGSTRVAGRRPMSLPLVALIALVLLVLVGGAVAAMRHVDQGAGTKNDPLHTPSVPAPAKHGGTPGPGATKAPPAGSSGTGPVRSTAPSTTRSATGSTAPTPRPTPTPTSRPSPTTPPTPSPTVPTDTATTPGDTPSPSVSPSAGDAGGGSAGDGGGGPGSGGATALRVSRGAPGTVDTGEWGSTT